VPTPPIGVALLAAGDEQLLRVSILAIGEAAARLEHAGIPTVSVVVDRTSDVRARAILGKLDGATVLDAAPDETEAMAYLRAIESMAPDVEHVLLCASDVAPVPGALVALHATAMASDADLVLACEQQPAPYALMHRRAAKVCAAAAAQRPDAPAVLTIARMLHDSGRPIAMADGAGAAFGDTSEVLPAEDSRGAYLHLARPDGVMVGSATYFGPRTVLGTWGPLEQIHIGSYCSFAWDVRVLHPGLPAIDVATGEPSTQIFRGSHLMNSPTTYPMGTLMPDEPYDEMSLDGSLVGVPMTIGSDVWVGSNALILGGITIGHGAIIGAGAVITKDVAPYAIVVGNPATVRRRRFPDATCERLLAVRWWDWHPVVVRGNHRRFAGTTDTFLDRFDPAGSLAG
jgi:acetyltransferase-like isoleucine patch superfamily enzyme